MSLPLARLVARAAPAMVARCWMRPAVAVLARPQAPLARCFTAGPTRLTKFSTRIAGLDVVPNGREVLIGLQKEILASIDQYNKALGFEPACNEYSRRFAAHRLTVAEEEDDVAQIESRLWSGQIEELIEQAENELDAVVLMNEEVKPWEKPDADILKQYQQLASANFGQDPAQFATGKSAELTKEEQTAVDEFWKPIDEEIRQDQAREAEERARRRAQRQ